MGGIVSSNKKDANAADAKAPVGSAAKYEDKSGANQSHQACSKSSDDAKNDSVKNAPVTTVAASEIAEEKNISIVASSYDSQVEEKLAPNHSIKSVESEKAPMPGTVVSHLERNDFSSSQITLFCVGDFVKVKFPNGTEPEGLVMEIVDEDKVVVDFCEMGFVKEVYVADCELIVKSDTMEVGDQVQVQPKGSAIFFVGRVNQINPDGTYDVLMEGDDPDDIEFAVLPTNIRKLMSRRAIVIARWKRAAMVVSSINNFQSFVVDPNMFNSSARANKEASVKAANNLLYGKLKSPPATD